MKRIMLEYAAEVLIGATLGVLLSVLAMWEQAKIPKRYHTEESTRYIYSEIETIVEVPVIEKYLT